jgi:hypothetical protein
LEDAPQVVGKLVSKGEAIAHRVLGEIRNRLPKGLPTSLPSLVPGTPSSLKVEETSQPDVAEPESVQS